MVTVPIAAGVGAALLLSGGLICFSDHALPGDALYSIKTGINEPIRAGLSASGSGKADAAMDRAAARLQEAAELAIKTDITPRQAEELADELGIATSVAQRKLAEVADKGGEAATSAVEDLAGLEDLLKGHADLLASLRISADADTRASLGLLENAVRAEAKDTAALRIALEAKGDLDARARALLATAEKDVAATKARLEAMRAGLSAGLAASADAQVTAAEGLLAEGRAKLDAGASAQASELFRAADAIAADASLIGNLLLDLDAQAAAEPKRDGVIQSVKTGGNSGIDLSGGVNVGVNGVNNADLDANGGLDVQLDLNGLPLDLEGGVNIP